MGEMAPTGLDSVTLKDLYATFADFSSEEALDIGAFTDCLQRMGIGMPALAERLFHAFDHAKIGRLDFRAFATGMSLICNDASAADRLELTFSILTNNTAVGLISAAEVKSLVREFLWAAMDVVQSLMDTTSTLFNPGGGDEVRETADVRRAVEAAAAAQVDRVADAIMQEAMAASGLAGREMAEGQGLGREEFRRWAAAQPRLLTWVAHLGQQWRVAVAEQGTHVARAAATAAADTGEPSLDSADVDVDGVREVVFGLKDWPEHAQQTLDEVEFAACMRKLGMKNEALAEHLFEAFDVNGNGFIDPYEFTEGLTRMCSKSQPQQLKLARQLFVADGDSVSREQFGRFVASFSALGLAQVQRHIDLFHDIFGAAGGSHGSFGQAVWEAANERMDAHTQRIVSRGFEYAGGESEMALDASQFEIWYDSTPAFHAWLGRTGATLAKVVAEQRTPAEVAEVKRHADKELEDQMKQDAAKSPLHTAHSPPATVEEAERLPRAAVLGGGMGGAGGTDTEYPPTASNAISGSGLQGRHSEATPRLRAMGHEREERDRERERRANERHERLLRAQQTASAVAPRTTNPSIHSSTEPSLSGSTQHRPIGGGPTAPDGDFRQFREQLYSSLSGAGLPLPQRPADAQDFRFLTEWLLRMREVQSHGQGELRMARNEIARLMDRVAALEKLVQEKDTEIIGLRDEAEDLRMRGPAQPAPQQMQMQLMQAAASGPSAPNAGASPVAGAGGVGLREMADELGRLEELLNEKNRATAELKATSAAADEIVLSVEDYEALRDECKKRAHEVDNITRQFEKEAKVKDTRIDELTEKISDMEFAGEQAMAMKADSQSKDAEIAELKLRLEEKAEEVEAERLKAIEAEEREAAGMQAMGWSKEGGEAGKKAAALVAAEQEKNKLLTTRIESLTADREDKRRRHREEFEKLQRELEALKTAASKSSADKRGEQKAKEKALQKDVSDLNMQVRKLKKDVELLEQSKRSAEMRAQKLDEELAERVEEVKRLKVDSKFRRKSLQKATKEAAEKSQQLARIQRSGSSAGSAGEDVRSRSSKGASYSQDPDPMAVFAELPARAAEQERRRLLGMLESMSPAETAESIRAQLRPEDSYARILGIDVASADDTTMHEQLLDAVTKGSDDVVSVAAELFPDDGFEESDDEDSEDFSVEDNWANKRNKGY